MRRLLSRLRDRLSGPPPAVGSRFLPEHREAAEQLRGTAEQALKLLAAGVVQSWEGALAELSRHLEARYGPERGAALAAIWSDALVGAEQPLGTLSRVAARSVDKGAIAAESTGELAALTRPLESKLSALPAKVREGWAGTTAHLRPLFEATGDPSLEAAFASGGPELAEALAAAASAFSCAAAALPEAPDLYRALFEAVDSYQGAALRAFETVINARYRLVAAAVARAGEDP